MGVRATIANIVTTLKHFHPLGRSDYAPPPTAQQGAGDGGGHQFTRKREKKGSMLVAVRVFRAFTLDLLLFSLKTQLPPLKPPK